MTKCDSIDAVKFPLGFAQCIGVAYTFNSSVRARGHLASAHAGHGATAIPFSYFYKGNRHNLSGHGDALRLRNDPTTGEVAVHSPEPELAMYLGGQHSVAGYCLANDLTASSLEGRTGCGLADSTYLAKVWMGCGSLGPRIVLTTEIGNVANVTIGLRIRREGVVVFDSAYSTSESKRDFESIPGAIVNKYNSYGGNLPLAKRIIVDQDGFLPAGTLIMLGTGLDLGDHHCIIGDVLTVYCGSMGELSNPVRGSSTRK